MRKQVFAGIMIIMLLIAPFFSFITSQFFLIPLINGSKAPDRVEEIQAAVDGAEPAINGTGPNLISTLASENSTTITQSTEVYFNDFNLSGPYGNEWVTANSNFTFSNFYADNITDLNLEDGQVSSINADSGNSLYQGFTLNTSARIINLSIYVLLTADDSPDLRVRIRNATTSNTPDTSLAGVQASSSFIELPAGWHWEPIAFNDELLNISNTFNNTFFVSVEMSGGAQLNWEYGSNGPNIGRVFRGAVDQEGIFGEIDMNLNVSLAPLSNTPTADQIGLQVNGTNVTSSNQLISTVDWNATSNEDLYFNVTSGWKVNYTLDTHLWYERNYTTPTNFSLSTNNNMVNWSAIISPASFASKGQMNKTITIDIPKAWNVTDVLNGTAALSSHPSWTWGTANSTLHIYDITTNSQDWRVDMNASNYLTGITIEEQQGISYALLPVNPTLNRSNTILRINGTMKNNLVATGDSNISVYLGPQLVYTETRDQNTTSLGQVNFSDWTIGNDVLTDGSYDVYVYWTNTTHMGLWTTTFEAINTTALTVVNNLNQTYYIGEQLNLTAYYNNTTDDQPVTGANVTYEIYNRTDSSLVTSLIDLPSDLGAGYYNATIDTSNFVNGTYDIQVSAQKSGCHNITLNQTFTLMYKTYLSLNDTLLDPYYHPTDLPVFVNYSYRHYQGPTEVNSTVLGANVRYEINDTQDTGFITQVVDNLYTITFNITDYTFENKTVVRKLNITAYKDGYETQTIINYWNTSEALTSFTLDNYVSTNLGTTYYNNSIDLIFSYNYTSNNTVVLNPDNITLRVDDVALQTYNLNYDSPSESYNITLNTTDYAFGLHDIDVFAERYGHNNHTMVLQWTTIIAQTGITNFTVNGTPIAMNTTDQHVFPNNMSFSFEYWNDTRVDGADANVSVDGVFVKSFPYYAASGTYNFTLTFVELGYTYQTLESHEVWVNISKLGYEFQFYNLTILYGEAPMNATITTNATLVVGNNHSLIFRQDLNVTVFLYDRNSGVPVLGADLNMSLLGTENVTLTELGNGYYSANYTLDISVGEYTLNLYCNISGYAPLINSSQLVNFTQTPSMLSINTTSLQTLHIGDYFDVNLTYWDTLWDEGIAGASFSSNWTTFSVLNGTGNYTFRVELNDSNVNELSRGGIHTIEFTFSHQNHTTAINTSLQVKIFGRTEYTLYNNTVGDEEFIGSAINATATIYTYENETAYLLIHYNSTDFPTVPLQGAALTTNWSIANWSSSEIGTNGTYIIRLNTTGLATEVFEPFQVNISLDNYENLTINAQVYSQNKSEAQIVFIGLPNRILAGHALTLTVNVTTGGLPVSGGTVEFIINGQIATATSDENGTATHTFTVAVGTLVVSARYIGNYSTHINATASFNILVGTGGLPPELIIIMIVVFLVIAIGAVSTVLMVRQRRRSKTKSIARKKAIVAPVRDLAKLQHLIVIHKHSSTDIFQYRIEEGIDPTLLAGFISAIKEFSKEIIRKEQTGDQEDQQPQYY